MSNLFNKKKKRRLGEILIDQGVLTPEGLDNALTKQKKEGGLLGELLLKMGLVKEEDIVVALADQFNIPYLPVQNCDVSRSVLDLVPVDLVKKISFIPIDVIGNVLTVIMVDPLDERGRKEIEEITGMKLQVLVGTATEIGIAVRKYYKIKDSLLSDSSFKSTKNKNGDST